MFIIAHAYRHYSGSGTGIKTLADIYLMNKKRSADFDRAKAERALNELGILGYEQRSAALAAKLFGGEKPLLFDELTDAEREMLSYYLGSGTYGTQENRIANTLKSKGGGTVSKKTKIRYLLGRLFPGRAAVKEQYPTVYRYPVLLPFLWIWRLLFRSIGARSRIRSELGSVKKAK